MTPALRAAPWAPVLAGSAAGGLLLLLVAGAPRLVWVVPLAFALLAGAAALALDEPAAAVVDSVPTSLRRRTVLRCLVAVVPLGTGAVTLAAVDRRLPELSGRLTLLEIAGCVLLALALAGAMRRRVPAPGEAAGAVVGLGIAGVALFEPLSRWVVVLPLQAGEGDGRTALLWSVVSIASVGVVAWCSRDPVSPRGPVPGRGRRVAPAGRPSTSDR